MKASELRERVDAALTRHFPGLRDRLRRWIPGRRTGFRLDARRTAFGGQVHAPSALHPLLSEHDLLVLARPKAECLDLEPLDRTSSGEHLEPVVEMSQMHRSPVSVCFVVALSEADPSALERTLQSVLRQTDSSWELLFGCSAGNAGEAARWLEIDWRVRRFEFTAAGLGDAGLLKSSAMYATTAFVGLLREGEVADDDAVMTLGAQLRRAPGLDVLRADAAHPGRRFTAVRKLRLLDLDLGALEDLLQREAA